MSDVSECFMSERSVGWEKKRKLSGVEEVVVDLSGKGAEGVCDAVLDGGNSSAVEVSSPVVQNVNRVGVLNGNAVSLETISKFSVKRIVDVLKVQVIYIGNMVVGSGGKVREKLSVIVCGDRPWKVEAKLTFMNECARNASGLLVLGGTYLCTNVQVVPNVHRFGRDLVELTQWKGFVYACGVGGCFAESECLNREVLSISEVCKCSVGDVVTVRALLLFVGNSPGDVVSKGGVKKVVLSDISVGNDGNEVCVVDHVIFRDRQLEFDFVCGVELIVSNVLLKTFRGSVQLHATRITRYVVAGESMDVEAVRKSKHVQCVVNDMGKEFRPTAWLTVFPGGGKGLGWSWFLVGVEHIKTDEYDACVSCDKQLFLFPADGSGGCPVLRCGACGGNGDGGVKKSYVSYYTVYDCSVPVKVVQVIGFKDMANLTINGRTKMFVRMCEKANGDVVLNRAVVY